MDDKEKREFVERVIESWGRPVVPRKHFDEFSSGVFAAGTLANADSRGKGPRGRFYIGQRAVYPVTEAAKWLADRISSSKRPAVKK